MDAPQRLHAIYLESQDEITDVMDQISHCPDSIIALVASDRLGILQSLTNLKLLQRSAARQQKELILVTSDQIANSLAGQIAMRSFSKLGAAERALFEGIEETPEEALISPANESADHPEPDPNNPVMATTGLRLPLEKVHLSDLDSDAKPPIPPPTSKKSLPTKSSLSVRDRFTNPLTNSVDVTNLISSAQPMLWLIGVFLLIFFGIGAYAATSLLPRATVLVVPQTQSFSQELTIRASATIGESNVLAKEVPAFYYETIEAAGQTGTASEQSIVGTRARGQVTIFNRGYSRAISLARGTELTSYDGHVFVVTSDVVIPAAQLDAGTVTASRRANIPVEARDVGEEFNISRTNFTVDGYATSALWAESNDAMAGGEQRRIVVVGENDVDSVRTRILLDIVPRAEGAVLSRLTSGQRFVENSFETQATQVEINPPIGEPAEEFTVRIVVRSRGLAVREADLQAIINHELGNTIPAGFASATEGDWPMSFEVQRIDFPGQSMTFVASGNGTIIRQLNHPELKRALSGKLPEDGNAVLEMYKPEIADFKIELWPGWVSRIPHRAEKVNIVPLSNQEFIERTR